MNATTLSELLQDEAIVLAPGIYDAFTGLLAEQAGARTAYLSGASIAYTRLGRPDIGLVSVSEVADTLALITDRIAIPVIVDADNGYGNALNVQRTVRAFERAGAAAIQLEDQTSPKRCGHLAGKSLIPTGEMVGKINAAVDVRARRSTLIVARTDAIAVNGIDDALERAGRYADAGADILFVEAPRSRDEMKTIVAALAGRVPLLANMVEGGKTPLLSAAALQEIGYRLVIFPGALVRLLSRSAQRYFESVLRDGGTELLREEMADFAQLNELIGTEDLLALGRKYDNDD